MILIALLMMAGGVGGSYFGAKASVNFAADLRKDIFAKVQKFSFANIDKFSTGSIVTRTTNDVNQLQGFCNMLLRMALRSPGMMIGGLIMAISIRPSLSVVFAVTMPLMIITIGVVIVTGFPLFQNMQSKVDTLNSTVQENVTNVRVVKSFANEHIEESKFKKGNEKFLEIKSKVYKYMGSHSSINRAFEGIMYILIVVAGAFALVGGKINAADYIAYLLYIGTLLTSIRKIIDFAEQFQRGMTGIERFAEIMDTEPTIKDKESAKELVVKDGRIEFENVTFKYSDETEEILDNMNISIGSGESFALVGPSGGGKTTICNLIPRFYELSEGSIKIDGTDIRDVTLKSLRENIGVVQQDVYLFSGTVRENIEYGKPGATEEEIREAARLAGAEEFIDKLPDGFDTYVGERGVKLSGGQKQRISIARVFLKNPKILILDEATSALDNESEFLVQQSLERLAKGRTTITVAHRLTTIKNADKILVVTKDGIAESGNHDELVAQNGLYSTMYKMYRV